MPRHVFRLVHANPASAFVFGLFRPVRQGALHWLLEICCAQCKMPHPVRNPLSGIVGNRRLARVSSIA